MEYGEIVLPCALTGKTLDEIWESAQDVHTFVKGKLAEGVDPTSTKIIVHAGSIKRLELQYELRNCKVIHRITPE